jgi:MFS family permease
MDDRAASDASATQAVAVHPPLSVAITTIGVMAIAMVGSSISSQLVDLDIADIADAFSVSADQASWIACAATMAEVAGIPIAAILARALSLRRIALCSAVVFVICAFASLFIANEEPLIVLRVIQSFCSGIISVLMFTAVMATLPPGATREDTKSRTARAGRWAASIEICSTGLAASSGRKAQRLGLSRAT